MLEVNTELIKRAQKGDEATLTAIYRHYQVGIFRYLYYRLGDPQLAEDMTSEVFERMLRFMGSFRPPSDRFPAWLFRIAHNLAADHYRKNSRRPQVALHENLADRSDSPEAGLERVLTSEILKQALAELSEEQREVIILRFVAELPIAEVSNTLGKSEDAVKGLQRRALINLRQILQDWKVSYEQD